MDVNWFQILIEGGVLTTVVILIETIRDWRNKRKEGKANAKKTDYQAQREGLDLVQEFYNKVKQVTDDQNSKLFDRMDKTDNKINEIVTYLNGDFAKWKEEHRYESN